MNWQFNLVYLKITTTIWSSLSKAHPLIFKSMNSTPKSRSCIPWPFSWIFSQINQWIYSVHLPLPCNIPPPFLIYSNLTWVVWFLFDFSNWWTHLNLWLWNKTSFEWITPIVLAIIFPKQSTSMSTSLMLVRFSMRI